MIAQSNPAPATARFRAMLLRSHDLSHGLRDAAEGLAPPNGDGQSEEFVPHA